MAGREPHAAPRTRSTVRALVLTGTIAVLLITARGTAGAVMERHFLYFPDPQLHMTPANVGLPYDDVLFPAEDGTMLHGWFIPGEPDRPVVLFFHGNAGNIADRVDNLVRLNRIGLAVFIFDYRGYGQSQGVPGESGLYSDARGALQWLRRNGHDADNTLYFGRSLGAAIALQLATEQPPLAIVLESPFTAITKMGRLHFPILYRLLGWLIAADYDNERKIKNISSPVLIIHGTSDSIVPVAMGQRLYELAPEPKRLFLVDGADHNDGIFLDDTYWDAWHEFIDECCGDREDRP